MATISEANEPHTSLMTYISDQDGKRIHMITSTQTKKWKNLISNQNVSLLIDTRESDNDPIKALTVKGKYIPTDDKENVLKMLILRYPFLKGISNQKDAELFTIQVQSFQLLEGIHDLYYIVV